MIRVEDEYTNTTPASAAYPEGSAKNVTSPGSTDGTPWELKIINDFLGMMQVLTTEGDVTPSGVPETVLASDTFTALTKLFQRILIHDDTGAADAYALTSAGNGSNIPAYSDTDLVTFKVANSNTGASTLKIGALVVKNLTEPDGTALAGGELIAGAYVSARYSVSNDRFELIAVAKPQNLIVITASGTYAKPAGLKKIKSTLVAGGGGSGGADTINGAASIGGGGGGSSIKEILASALSASETVTIGAGGSGGAIGVTGSNGGATSFGAHHSATGGVGGTGVSSASNRSGVDGGVGSGGDLNIEGSGSEGVYSAGNVASGGGSSILGGGVRGTNSSNIDGAQYGGGGGGVVRTSGVDRTGADGADGVIIIEEFF